MPPRPSVALAATLPHEVVESYKGTHGAFIVSGPRRELSFIDASGSFTERGEGNAPYLTHNFGTTQVLVATPAVAGGRVAYCVAATTPEVLRAVPLRREDSTMTPANVADAPTVYRAAAPIIAVYAEAVLIVVYTATGQLTALLSDTLALREIGTVLLPALPPTAFSGTNTTGTDAIVSLSLGPLVGGTARMVLLTRAGLLVSYCITTSAITPEGVVPLRLLGAVPRNHRHVTVLWSTGEVALATSASKTNTSDGASLSVTLYSSDGAQSQEWSLAALRSVTTGSNTTASNTGVRLQVIALSSVTQGTDDTGAGTGTQNTGRYAVLIKRTALSVKGQSLGISYVVAELVKGREQPVVCAVIPELSGTATATMASLGFRSPSTAIVTIGSACYLVTIGRECDTESDASKGKAAYQNSFATKLRGTSVSTTVEGSVQRDVTHLVAAGHDMLSPTASPAAIIEYFSTVHGVQCETIILLFIASLHQQQYKTTSTPVSSSAQRGAAAGLIFSVLFALPESAVAPLLESGYGNWVRAVRRRKTALVASSEAVVGIIHVCHLLVLLSLRRGALDVLRITAAVLDALLVEDCSGGLSDSGKSAVQHDAEALTAAQKCGALLKATGHWAAQDAGRVIGVLSAHCTGSSPATKQPMHVQRQPFRIVLRKATELYMDSYSLTEPPRQRN